MVIRYTYYIRLQAGKGIKRQQQIPHICFIDFEEHYFYLKDFYGLFLDYKVWLFMFAL